MANGKMNIKESLAQRIGVNNKTPSSINNDYDKAFGLDIASSSDAIIELDIKLLSPHPSDKFKYYNEDKLRELANSIKDIGLLEPILVRPIESGYQILGGKNRSKATLLNGHTKIKSIIREVDDDTAIMIMTDSNLKHRESLYPSEKGWAYRMQVEALSRQGQRTDLIKNSTSVDNQQKLNGKLVVDSDNIKENQARPTDIEKNSTSVNCQQRLSRRTVAENNEVKENEVQRYVRLTYLTEKLLENVDENNIHIMSGVYFSYLDKVSQDAVYQYHESIDYKSKIAVKKAKFIRKTYEEQGNSLEVEQIHNIIESEKKVKQSKSFSIDRNKFKDFSEYLPDDTKLENLFLQFLNEKYGVNADKMEE